MYKLIVAYFAIFVLAGLVIRHINHTNWESDCLNSIYKTADYKLENGVLHCRSSDNSYQKLRKWYESPHLNEHRSDHVAKKILSETN